MKVPGNNEKSGSTKKSKEQKRSKRDVFTTLTGAREIKLLFVADQQLLER